MSKSIELKEQRAGIIEEARKIIDTHKNEDFNGETQERYDAMMTDIDRLEKEVKLEERKEHQAKLENEVASTRRETRTAPHRMGSNTEENERRSFNVWLRKQSGMAVNPNDLDSSGAYNPYAKEIEVRTGMSVGSNSAGGYLAPTLFPTQLERFLKYFCPLRNFVRVYPTTDGNPLPWPQISITSVTEPITTETNAIPEGDPTASNLTLNSYKVSEKILISTELLTDSFVDLIPLVSSLIGEVIGRSEELLFETGSGTNTCTGFVTAAQSIGSQVDSNLTGTLSFNNVMDLLASLDPIYEPDAILLVSNKTKWLMRSLVDANGRYLWSSLLNNVTTKFEDTLLDHKVVTASSMFDYSGSGAGTGSSGTEPFMVAMVPNMFVIRTVGGVKVSTNPYLYQATGQVAIFGEERVDSKYVGPSNSIAYLAN